MKGVGLTIADLMWLAGIACAPAIIFSGLVIFSYDGAKRLFHRPAAKLSRAKRFFIMAGVITAINLLMLIGGSGSWLGALSNNSEDKDLYIGSITGSAGEAVDVRVYVDNHGFHPKDFVELTDKDGRVTRYRTYNGNGKSSAPRDYISYDMNNGDRIIWVLDSGGGELIGLNEEDDVLTCLFGFDENYHTYVSDEEIKLIDAAEKTGFLDKLPDSSKADWKTQFRMAKEVYKERKNDT